MKKNFIAICIVVFVLILVFSGTKIQSVDDYYLTHIDDIKEDSKTVMFSINCETILNNWNKLDDSLKLEKYVPSNGVILTETKFVLRHNDTVFDILDRAIRKNKIQMECLYSTSFGSIYVQGLNHLYEFSCGELSGWMYKVNGVFPNYGCSTYKLKDGDIVSFVYTCDLGRDVGANLVNK